MPLPVALSFCKQGVNMDSTRKGTYFRFNLSNTTLTTVGDINDKPIGPCPCLLTALIYHDPAPLASDEDEERILEEVAYEAGVDVPHDVSPHAHAVPTPHYDMAAFEQHMYGYMDKRFNVIQAAQQHHYEEEQ